MTPNRLSTLLRTDGIRCALRDSDETAFCGLLRSSAMVSCVESGDPCSPSPDCGIVFWFRVDSGILLLVLYSGITYYVRDPSASLSLARAILHSKALPRGRVPRSLPRQLVTRFSLEPCSPLQFWPGEQLRSVLSADGSVHRELTESTASITRESILTALRPHVNSVVTFRHFFLMVKLGRARAITRISRATRHRFLPMLVMGDVTESADHVNLLQTICRELKFHAYDMAWHGIHVSLDDPYYACGASAKRPGAPRAFL